MPRQFWKVNVLKGDKIKMAKNAFETFKQTLEEHHTWPCEYMFKFIAPKIEVGAVEEFLAPLDGKITKTASKTGKYISITAKCNMQCADDVVNIYENSAVLKGVITL
jgi:putative lipoic acid-binding regulatory protein